MLGPLAPSNELVPEEHDFPLRARQRCFRDLRLGIESRAIEASVGQIGATEIGALEVRIGEVRSTEIEAEHIDA